MKSIQKRIMILLLFVSFASCNAQIKNETSITEKIAGNCGMCKKTIEKAGNLKNEASVNWDKETKLATLTFDSKKTSKEAILKRIALAGYDNESYLAPKEAYESLPQCCQYDRLHKQQMDNTDKKTEETSQTKNNQTDLEKVFANYFELKDVLVDSNVKDVSLLSKKMLEAIEKVNMHTLDEQTHLVWMQKMKVLKENASALVNSKKIEEQRSVFIDLSENIYALIKVAQTKNTIYYQHCPMANNGKGANWLSKEKEIKNPYYGSMMLSCGKTIETLK